MTGLDLEPYLRMLRADPSKWVNASIFAAFLISIAWASRGRRRILQRCLIVSLSMHVGLMVFGGPQAARWFTSDPMRGPSDTQGGHLQRVELIDRSRAARDSDPLAENAAETADGRSRPIAAPWDHPQELALEEVNPPLPTPVPDPEIAPAPRTEDATNPLLQLVEVPDPALPNAAPSEPAKSQFQNNEPTPLTNAEPVKDTERAFVETPRSEGSKLEAEPAVPEPAAIAATRSEPVRSTRPRSPDSDVPIAVPAALAGAGIGRVAGDDARPNREVADRVAGGERPEAPVAMRGDETQNPAPLASAPSGASGGNEFATPDLTPSTAGTSAERGTELAMRTPRNAAGATRIPLVRPAPSDTQRPELPARIGIPGARAAADVPEVYRSRLAPNRSTLALAAGATPASEEAVERALEWLARHQDLDGRWNAATHRNRNGQAVGGDTSFTAHCPAGDVCEGECYYSDADTAITGLAMLAFLGAGHTHQSGPYARNLALGINYLLKTQKADGDLRGESTGVGMYCHAIAALALSEAYALSRDARLRDPVERAVTFLIRIRAKDRQAWRYQPGDPDGGDTSILGWAVMVLKSAKEVGVEIPDDVRKGVLVWLGRVADGRSSGLAMYRPTGSRDGGQITPTMTAEAWVCRQFLGVGGPGPASDEAATYLLQRGPDRDPYNLYYWYYGTLALFQHGGEPWVRWNERVRDQLVRRQARSGHANGSWDPLECRDRYNDKGGRVYSTAIATLTLEVYYRYLRLYDAPATPLPGSPQDNTVRRAEFRAEPAVPDLAPVPDSDRL